MWSPAPVVPMELRLPSPLEELHDDRLARAGVRLLLKRDDLLLPEGGSNALAARGSPPRSARRKPALDEFIAGFAGRHGIMLDWVYPAKMMYGIYTLAGRGKFPPGSTIVAVITG